MSNATIKTAVTDGIATISLHRPEKCNAINGEMIQALSEALQIFATQETVRVLLLQGDGKHFCAGADLAWMQKIAQGSYNDNYDDAQKLADLIYQLYLFPKPTMVLAQGSVLGGGLGLLAACDIAIATQETRFGFPEVKIGLAPSVVSPYVLAAIGERAAHYYFLTGESFDATTAKELKLIHRIVETSALLATGIELANTLLKNAPKALIATKQLLRHVTKEKITPELAQKTAEHLANLRSSIEAQEKILAFLNKDSI